MQNIQVQDLFNFRDYVLFLKDKLDNTQDSETVWVHGDYWAWKTTTMNIIKQLYKEDKLGYDNILEFSAWRNYYNKEDTVWKALLYELAGKIVEVFEDLDKEKVKFSIQWIWSDSINWDQILKQLKEDWFWKFEIKFNYDKKDFLNNILYDYVKLTCLEIQYNLYQDLKDFDWELKKWKSEIEKHPFIGMWKILLKTITETKDLTELFFSWRFSWIIWKIFSKNNENNKDEESNEKSLLNLFKKEEQELKKVRIDSLEVIQRKFDILLELYNLISFNNKKIKQKPLIIMIDDLDRILPEKSVEIIEILRIFFEKSQKIHFICAIDIRVIEKWIERKFNQLNQWWDLSRIEFEEYLEKIITIPFDLPAIPFWSIGIDNNITTLITNEVIIYDEQILKDKKQIEEKILDKLTKNKSIFDKIYKNDDFLNIVLTWLQTNPRKIIRFKKIFDIYIKILVYRIYNFNYENIKNYELDIDKINKFSYLLAKLLIIKLEWDELYKEISKDKLFLPFLEDLAMKINWDTWQNDFNISSKIWLLTKKTKNYKIWNLYWMLWINNDKTIFNEEDIVETYKNIYIVYYLIPDNTHLNLDVIQKNENIMNITNSNLLKYLYSDESNKISFYIKHYSKLLQKIKEKHWTPDNIDKIEEILEKYVNQLNYYKNFLESNN